MKVKIITGTPDQIESLVQNFLDGKGLNFSNCQINVSSDRHGSNIWITVSIFYLETV